MRNRGAWMEKRSRWIVAALSFLWLAFVYASYYLVQQQRPFGAANLRAVVSVLLDLGTAGAFLAAGGCSPICHGLAICQGTAGLHIAETGAAVFQQCASRTMAVRYGQ